MTKIESRDLISIILPPRCDSTSNRGDSLSIKARWSWPWTGRKAAGTILRGSQGSDVKVGLLMEVIEGFGTFSSEANQDHVASKLDRTSVAVHSKRTDILQPREAKDDFMFVHMDSVEIHVEASTLASHRDIRIQGVREKHMSTS